MNLTRYQDPNYIAGWSPMDLRVIQQNIQGRQKRYDDIMQKYADTQALLNDSEVYDVQSATELRNKFEEGFDRLFDATGGDFVTYHNDAYRYLANAKADPAYGLLKQHAEAYKNFLKRKEQAGETGLVFKEMPERIVDENGYYRDPSEFTFKVEPMENWGGTQSELAGRAMQQTGWESEFRNLGNGYLESITQTGVRDLDQVLGNISKGLPGKVNQLLQNYIETTAGQQQLAWYEKGMKPGEALDKIKRELVSAATLYATKGTSNRTRVQDVDYQASSYGTGTVTGTGTPTSIPVLPGTTINKGTDYNYWKDANNASEATSKWAKDRDNAKGLLTTAALPITDVLFPDTRGKKDRTAIAAGAIASAYGSEQDTDYLYSQYKSRTSSPMTKEQFRSSLFNISQAYDDMSRLNYYSTMKPSTRPVETKEYAFVPALTLTGMPTAEAMKERDRVMSDVFSSSRLLTSATNGGYKAYGTIDVDEGGLAKALKDGKLVDARDLIKDQLGYDFKVENVGVTAAPYDKDKDGQFTQSVVVTISGKESNTASTNARKQVKLRIPINQINDPVFNTMRFSFNNSLHTAYNRPMFEMGLTNYSLKQTSPSVFSKVKKLRADGDKIHDIKIVRNPDGGGDYSDTVMYIDKQGNVIAKETGTEFLSSTSNAYNEVTALNAQQEMLKRAAAIKRVKEEVNEDSTPL